MLSGGLRRKGRMPRRKEVVRLFSAHRLTGSWVLLDTVLGAPRGGRAPAPARTGGAEAMLGGLPRATGGSVRGGRAEGHEERLF